MAADLDLKMTLQAIDKASAPIRAVGQSFVDLRQKAGIPAWAQIGARIAGIGRAAAGAAAGVAALGGVGVIGGLAGVVTALAAVRRLIIPTAVEFERLNVRMEALAGSASKAELAMEWVDRFAARKPAVKIQEAAEAYIALKKFGIDPTNGSMASLVDTMAKYGQNAIWLMATIEDLGEAWSEKKLGAGAINKLVKAGIPAWDMLAKATGKSVPVLQALAAKGKLGRKSLKALVQAMGKDSIGASEKAGARWDGVWNRIADIWTRFQIAVAGAGVFEMFTGWLADLASAAEAMAAGGSLKALAIDIGTGMVDAAKALIAVIPAIRDAFRDLAGAVKWLGENFGWLLDVGKAFYDVISWQWRQISAVAQAVAAAFDAVSGAIGRLPKLPDWLPKLLGLAMPGGLAAGALGAAAPTLSSAGSSLVSRIEGAIGINITGAPKGTSVSASSSTPGLVLAPTLGPGMLGHI